MDDDKDDDGEYNSSQIVTISYMNMPQ